MSRNDIEIHLLASKFVRRLAIDKVMAARLKKIYDLKPEQHGRMNIYEYLTGLAFRHFSLRLKKFKIASDISNDGLRTTTFVPESPMTRV